ncbi:cytochrome P450 [Nocardia aurantia]|uniref:Polyketide biosynthesis cytochrome P450 PksS n=1 Tax=Nocardia aurantia TaxID=2585199 RepID=A0A7K0DTQ5_9NOCA|nr:cytochrome P450 [Nocardia aurantia]MQY28917.1 Polyketide biosynthesis cytochrome P450 PksS [Nocardia aurantia]
MPTETVIFGDKYFRDPHGFYRDVHAGGSLHRFTTPSGVHGWLITGDQLARNVLTDPRIGKGRDTMLGVTTADEHRVGLRSRARRYGTEWVVTHMLGSDPPDHTRLRAAVADHFTPKAVTALTPRIQALTDELLDKIDPSTPIDLATTLAGPLPVAIICHITGIPASHRLRIERSSQVLSDVTVANSSELRTAGLDFTRLILPRLIARRWRPRGDLMSTLGAGMATGEVDLKEALSTVALLLIAGHETTSNLILGTLLALLRDRNEFDRARAEPEHLASVINETLRTDPPLPVTTLRQAHTDVDVDGQRIRRGELLLVSLLAANHDPETVNDPHVFDPDRTVRHMSFGVGVHHCLGARLAKVEATIAVAELIQRHPRLQLAVPIEELRWRRSVFFRRLECLPVTF